MIAWLLFVGEVVVVGACLAAVRSFGKWTKQLLHTEKSNQLILAELRLLRQPVFRGDAVNHAANFVNVDPPEQESA